jgi:hypothetical protein
MGVFSLSLDIITSVVYDVDNERKINLISFMTIQEFHEKTQKTKTFDVVLTLRGVKAETEEEAVEIAKSDKDLLQTADSETYERRKEF